MHTTASPANRCGTATVEKFTIRPKRRFFMSLHASDTSKKLLAHSSRTPAPRFSGRQQEVPCGGDAGVVDRVIEPSMLVEHRLHHLLHRAFIGNIQTKVFVAVVVPRWFAAAAETTVPHAQIVIRQDRPIPSRAGNQRDRLVYQQDRLELRPQATVAVRRRVRLHRRGRRSTGSAKCSRPHAVRWAHGHHRLARRPPRNTRRSA